MSGKTIVITGANRGLGLALAQTHAALGHTVIGTCRSPHDAGALAATGAEVRSLDMADGTSIAALGTALAGRGIDVLYNSAGIDGRNLGMDPNKRNVLDMDGPHFLEVMNVNVVGPMLLVQALADSLRQAKGIIVNISSQVGSMEVGRKIGSDISYNASKSAMNMLTVKQSAVLEPDGVTAIAMHPGWLQTDMGGPAASLDPVEAAKIIAATVGALTIADTGRFIRWDGTTHPW